MDDDTIQRLREVARHAATSGRSPFADISPEMIERVVQSWRWQAHRGQLPPARPWRVWLLMAGRGFGKTRAGAEWIHAQARAHPTARIALVGHSYDDARRVMVEGASGLIETAGADETPRWNRSKGELRFASGAIGFVYSAVAPETLRGPEHHLAWCDELAKWGVGGDAAWDNLMMGLRLGAAPRVVVTTTPRTMALLRRLRALDGTVEEQGRTQDNRQLPAAFLDAMQAAYGGTRLGRQEMDGELIEDVEDSMFARTVLERGRVAAVTPAEVRASPWLRVVVGVDPAVSAHGDACGIVVCAMRDDGSVCVVDDATVLKPTPERWSRAVVGAAARWQADKVVVEANQGGDLVRKLIADRDPDLKVEAVHATRGKSLRAAPVSVWFERGDAALAGSFAALEDQLNGLTNGGRYIGPGRSPDRADAMVYAMVSLRSGRAEPAVRSLGA